MIPKSKRVASHAEGGTFFGEAGAGFPASGSVEEAAVGVIFEAEGNDKVSNFYSVWSVFGDGLSHVFGVDDLRCLLKCADVVDLLSDVEFPSDGR